MTMERRQLPAAGPAAGTVLAFGGWLKNTACLLQGDGVTWSPLHGDLGDPDNRVALAASATQLVRLAGGAIDAVAHDLHPDFYSTRLALEFADRLGVPAIGCQHHHAHIGAVMAEHGMREPVIGVALDGIGHGTDGLAWGGELLLVDGARWRRLGHLQALGLPGGDIAAREPWRMAAAGLHALGRGNEIGARFAASAGEVAARTVQAMLARDINCPNSTAAGRWFDAAAGALGISVRQAGEAEAAIALEQLAARYLAANDMVAPAGLHVLNADGTLDLLPMLEHLFALADEGSVQAIGHGAALFHLVLVQALAEWTAQSARRHGVGAILFGGGCFYNRILRDRLHAQLTRHGLRALSPQSVSCGDAGLALGQAWVARQQLHAAVHAADTGLFRNNRNEVMPCVSQFPSR